MDNERDNILNQTPDYSFNEDYPPACLNPMATVIAQYANSPHLLKLIDFFAQNVIACPFFDRFYREVWNLDTAGNYGLQVWGNIVGINRTIRSLSNFWVGFNEETLLLARPFNETLDRATFWNGRDSLYNDLYLNANNFKKVIYVKAAANISDGSIASLNKILMMLFSDKGQIYIQDNQDMTATVIANWKITPTDASLLMTIFSVLMPAGVGINLKMNEVE